MMSNLPSPIRGEYPRPDRVRENWLTLNGQWDFAFDRENRGLAEQWYRSSGLDGGGLRIEVPFPYQSKLSGIDSQEHCDVVWYQRTFELPENLKSMRRLLHFGAADYRTQVWLDGQLLGTHEGGYSDFTFDVTDLTESRHSLTVRCEDRLDFDQPRGKQSYRPEPFACWYTPVTGLWQSVWLEGVGEYYPLDFRLTPDVENGAVQVEVSLNELPKRGALRLTASFEGKLAACQEVGLTTDRYVRTTLFLRHDEEISGLHCWWPGSPSLYDLTIETLADGQTADRVETYFGLRKVGVWGDKITLNNSPLYQRLILDQGYWQDGLLTAPSAQALKKDVELTLAMGYNGARKHQKFEDPIYLYWADKLGLLVWSELPSAYWLRDSEKRNLMRDLSEAIRRDYNHPSIIVWTPLNESWGVPAIQSQREAQQLNDCLYHMVHCLDGTRLVSGNDGWEQAETDIVTVHDYTAWPQDLSPGYQSEDGVLNGAPSGKIITAQGYGHWGKPKIFSEFGGIAMAKDAGGENWGYHGAVADGNALLERFGAITRGARELPGFSGYCYTQLTDVFQEVNGLLDMDRQPKAPLEEIRKRNS